MARTGFDAHVYIDARVLADAYTLLVDAGYPPPRTISGLIRAAVTTLRDSNVPEAGRTMTVEAALTTLTAAGLMTRQLSAQTGRALTLRLNAETAEPPADAVGKVHSWFTRPIEEEDTDGCNQNPT